MTELKDDIKQKLYEITDYDPIVYYYITFYEEHKNDGDEFPDFEEMLMALVISLSNRYVSLVNEVTGEINKNNNFGLDHIPEFS